MNRGPPAFALYSIFPIVLPGLMNGRARLTYRSAFQSPRPVRFPNNVLLMANTVIRAGPLCGSIFTLSHLVH